MPGCLLVIAALLYWIPQRVRARGGEDWIPRGAALGVILAASLSLLTISSVHVRERDAPVGSGPDGFLAGARGPAMAAAVSEVRRRLSAEQTLAVLPEGVMLNYLSRRRAPTRHINYMPPELIIFGEDQILADLSASPPDYVALTRKDVREYGYRAFGQDYGRELLAWALRSYRPVRLFGEPPLRRRRGSPRPGFGILLMERRQRPQDLAPEDRLE
jgi:hypothetical protein